MWVVVEDSVGELTLPQARVITVPFTSGYGELATKIKMCSLSLKGCKVLFLFIGRFDVLDHSSSVEPKVERLQKVVGYINPAIILVLSTPLPREKDDVRITRKLFHTGHILRLMCQGKARMVFVRTGAEFTTLQGVNQDCFL